MKKYIVFYKPKGAEYKFQSPWSKTVNAYTAREARTKVIDWVGDIYKAVKVTEIK